MTPAALIKVAVVAVSLGLDVFAVSVGVGMRGVPVALRWRIGIAFTTAEVTMTLIGVGLGAVAGRLIGDVAGYFGFAALIGVGIYMLVEAMREREGGGIDFSRGWGLFLGAVSISLDSLGIGFSILYIGAPLAVSLVTIGVVAASSTTLGLTIGRLLGARAEESAERWAAIILILTGLGFAALKAFGRG
jgi:putative Mn2+ efflux pump MntP